MGGAAQNGQSINGSGRRADGDEPGDADGVWPCCDLVVDVPRLQTTALYWSDRSWRATGSGRWVTAPCQCTNVQWAAGG